jgi:hypothetical protein
MNLLRLGAIGAAFVFAACFERVADPGKDGNSSETVALVGGKVVDANGNGVKGAWVALVPDAYNPIASSSLPNGLVAATDGKGGFAFTKVPKGKYGFEARHPVDGTRLFNLGMDLGKSRETIATDTLRKPGRIRVRIPDYFKEPGGFIYIPHTRFSWAITGTVLEHGYLDLDSLPACDYGTLAFAKDSNLAASDTLGRDLEVQPGDSASVGPFAGWTRSARISINTSATGADIPATVTGFPMLVRLTSAELDFSQTEPGGADLRFSKPDGNPVLHQIDHWDAAKREAAVWVLLDTVRANDTAQWFRMHWGKPGAATRSDGPSVFASAGFAAAWHMEEDVAGTGAAGVYRNSAGNANHGLDSLSTADRGGMIGNGHYFARGDYVRVPAATASLKPANALTLSAWFKASDSDSDGVEIASMGNDYGLRVKPDGEAYMFNFNLPRTDSTNHVLVSSGQRLLDGQWHLFSGVWNGTRMEAFVDGVSVASHDSPKGVIKYDGGPDFFLGTHGNGETPYDFSGHIDEVSLQPVAADAAWQKLAYQTQKPGAAVLRFSR